MGEKLETKKYVFTVEGETEHQMKRGFALMI